MLANILNDKLQNINQWFSTNLLPLNLNKTCFMVFSKCKTSNNPVTIAINGVPLEQVHETTFHGVVISGDFKWKKQIYLVVQKISKIIGLLYRVRHVLDKDKLTLFYSALLEPYMYIIYCCSVWSSLKGW